jgi:NADH-quinone oxidoreductase subunit N
VGFVGKFYLFSVAVDAGLYELAVFGVLASVASAYYYLRVIVKMYMEEPATTTEPAALEIQNAAALLAASAGVFVFAAFPALMLLR